MNTPATKSNLPAFLVQRRPIIRKKVKKAKVTAMRFEGDVGTPEQQRKVLVPSDAQDGSLVVIERTSMEARDRSSVGHVTMVGKRVEVQFPHDRYKQRKLLDPDNEIRNQRLWDAAERLREDFFLSGMQPRLCSNFQPRTSGGRQEWEADRQVDAFGRYKKAMAGVGISLRSPLFYICIEGQYANEWAVKNGMIPQAGLSILRMALAELAHYYGYAKLTIDTTSLTG